MARRHKMRVTITHDDGDGNIKTAGNVLAYDSSHHPTPSKAFKTFYDNPIMEHILRDLDKNVVEEVVDNTHVLGDDCDICDGSGRDYIGRPCRLLREN